MLFPYQGSQRCYCLFQSKLQVTQRLYSMNRGAIKQNMLLKTGLDSKQGVKPESTSHN